MTYVKTYNIKIRECGELLAPEVKVKSRETGDVTYAAKVVAKDSNEYDCLFEAKVKINLDRSEGPELVSAVEEWIKRLARTPIDEANSIDLLNELVAELSSYVCYHNVKCRYEYGVSKRGFLTFEATIY